MKFNKVGKAVLTVGVVVFSIGLTTTSTASAKETVKSVTSHLAKVTTFKVGKKSAAVYSTASLNHKEGTLKSFGSKVKAYHISQINRNGKKTIYYQIKTGKKSGWVWQGYLVKNKQPDKSIIKAPNNQKTETGKFSESVIDAQLLKLVNQQRAKIGVRPVTVNSKLFDKVTTVRAHQLIKNYSHFDAHNHFIAADLAQKNKINYSKLSENIAKNNFNDDNISLANAIFYKYFYDDAASNWGHKKNILDSKVDKAAFATININGTVYNVMNFYGTHHAR
ncbi:CAP domain-containing protein [Secundilactobacillus silagei]|nr:CAP domain-containing protein [Secundilactobacillus silagei]